MAELVDARDSKSRGATHEGSIPSSGTKGEKDERKRVDGRSFGRAQEAGLLFFRRCQAELSNEGKIIK